MECFLIILRIIMRILIASTDSQIGNALRLHYSKDNEVVCTTRYCEKTSNLFLDVKEPKWNNLGKFNKVFFTIANDNPTGILDVFDVNVKGAILWLELVAKYGAAENCQIVVLSSQVGSISEVNRYSNPWYRMSKAALNMGVSLLNHKYKNCRWLCVHPGLVETAMTKDSIYFDKKITVDESAKHISELLKIELPFGFYDAVTKRKISW